MTPHLLAALATMLVVSFLLGRHSVSTPLPSSVSHHTAFRRALVGTERPEQQRRPVHPGFYLPKEASLFYNMAATTGTDKVSNTPGNHDYEYMYSKYFESMRRRAGTHKLLEIGLGCNMAYGPGASSKLWRMFLPDAKVWMAEYSSDCVKATQAKLDEAGIHVVTGDQADTSVLHRWVKETGGNFDVIIDDGGHTSMQQFNSFIVLFEHALKPGGVYFLEDIGASRWAAYVDGDGQHVTIDWVKEWVDMTVMAPLEGDPVEGAKQGYKYVQRFGLPRNIKAIECSTGICAFTKCHAHDDRCAPSGPHRANPYVDYSLIEYSSSGKGDITAAGSVQETT